MIIKRLISYYYEFINRLIKWKWDNSISNSSINGVALMYHHISEYHLDVLDSCQHTIEQFINSLVTYQERGYEFVSIDEAYEIISSNSTKKFAVITFDDVPLSAYEFAVPVLQEKNIPFTFFITTEYLGKEGYITEKHLLVLDKLQLCTIGAHSVSHPMLRNVKNIGFELRESKKILESLLGHTVNYLAYPYGLKSSVSRKVIREANKIGYKCAFGTIQSLITDTSSRNLFYLPRVVCH